MKQEIAVVKFNHLSCFIVFCFVISIIYFGFLDWKDLGFSLTIFGSIEVWKGLVSITVLTTLFLSMVLSKITFNKNGFKFSIGIGPYKFRRKLTWEQLEIHTNAFWILGGVAITTNRFPVMARYSHSGYKDALKLIARYGMDRVYSDSDKEYIEKIIEDS